VKPQFIIFIRGHENKLWMQGPYKTTAVAAADTFACMCLLNKKTYINDIFPLSSPM
jgi:hypothetical protein